MVDGYRQNPRNLIFQIATRMAYLVTLDSSVIKKRYRLDNEVVVIGRHPSCDIVIEDNAVSRRHAQIRRPLAGFPTAGG